MTTEALNNYVAAQVQQLADQKVKPLIVAINEELAGQTRNNDHLAAVTAKVNKDNEESKKRITELQKQLGVAQQAVAALNDALTTATAPAAE